MIIDYSTCDDESVSSIDVVNLCSQKNPTASKKARRVNFNEKSNVHHENHLICQEDVRDLWYSAADYLSFKEKHIESAKKMLKVERQRLKDADSYMNVIKRTYRACARGRKLSELDFLDLQIAISNTKYLGMEKSLVRYIRLEKKMCHEKFFDRVMEIQNKYVCEDVRAQMIADVSQEMSHASSLFAAVMAQANFE